MLSNEESKFIADYENADPLALRLQYAKKTNLNYSFLIDQIESRKKGKLKIPELIGKNVILPPSKNLEQSSSEITAKYKASLVSGKSGIDLTGGFGVDSIYLSKKFTNFVYVEPNEALCKINKHNFDLLQTGISIVNSNAEDYIKENELIHDFIYLDPSRRTDTGSKTIFIEDYYPNVIELQDQLNDDHRIIMIKVSPLLDISNTLKSLKSVKEVHIVSIKNDVKEVIYIIKDKVNNKDVKVLCINYLNNNNFQSWESVFSFDKAEIAIEKPLEYIYEPNAAIMKSGLFHHIHLPKLHNNSHLYTSNQLIKDFPGRIFKLKNQHNYSKKALKHIEKANITTRNFPYSVEEVRKKTKLKDGGDIYLFATTVINDKPVILECRKVEV